MKRRKTDIKTVSYLDLEDGQNQGGRGFLSWRGKFEWQI